MIIERAAFFLLCKDCGGHGHIVCKDGSTESCEFATVSKGLQELTSLMLEEKISWDESLEVKRQIETSKLERKSQALDDYLEWLIEQEEPDISADTEEKQSPHRRNRTLN